MVTNGTIVPSDKVLRAIKDVDMFVFVSNYDDKSKKLDALTKKLTEHKIPYYAKKMSWFAMSQLTHNTPEEAKGIFDRCKLKLSCPEVINGKQFICAFLANAEDLRAIPYDNRNSFDLLDPLLSKEDLRRFLYSNEMPPGCLYCSGWGGADSLAVPVAEQISSSMPYKQYDNY
ncbi:hypothetical protein AGMMS50276_30010 [Synergistales bacterium]|nr:hypothetical protein AGMMS50276_30010 [Synergistales bacterium]